MLQGYVGVPLDSCQMSLQHAMADSCTAESRPHKASRLPTMSLTAGLGFLFFGRARRLTELLVKTQENCTNVVILACTTPGSVTSHLLHPFGASSGRIVLQGMKMQPSGITNTPQMVPTVLEPTLLQHAGAVLRLWLHYCIGIVNLLFPSKLLDMFSKQMFKCYDLCDMIHWLSKNES